MGLWTGETFTKMDIYLFTAVSKKEVWYRTGLLAKLTDCNIGLTRDRVQDRVLTAVSSPGQQDNWAKENHRKLSNSWNTNWATGKCIGCTWAIEGGLIEVRYFIESIWLTKATFQLRLSCAAGKSKVQLIVLVGLRYVLLWVNGVLVVASWRSLVIAKFSCLGNKSKVHNQITTSTGGTPTGAGPCNPIWERGKVTWVRTFCEQEIQF